MGLDEARPGNFIFYDLTQNLIGSNDLDDIAVAMACPVVAVHPEANKLIIYGGGVHFSKDRLDDPTAGVIYGRVVRHEGLYWSTPITDLCLTELSQEHGTVTGPKELIKKYRVGDYLIILPVHSCMCANLMKAYYNVDVGRRVERL